nr:hypothetical protein [Abalone asfa-like virus]
MESISALIPKKANVIVVYFKTPSMVEDVVFKSRGPVDIDVFAVEANSGNRDLSVIRNTEIRSCDMKKYINYDIPNSNLRLVPITNLLSSHTIFRYNFKHQVFSTLVFVNRNLDAPACLYPLNIKYIDVDYRPTNKLSVWPPINYNTIIELLGIQCEYFVPFSGEKCQVHGNSIFPLLGCACLPEN